MIGAPFIYNVDVAPSTKTEAMNSIIPNYELELLQWGLSQTRITEAPEELLFSLTKKLTELELEPGLVTACIRTPHPQLDMLVFRWRPLKTEEVPTSGTESILGQKTSSRTDGVQDIYFMVRGHTDEGMWKSSPFHKVLKDGNSLRVPLDPPPSQVPFQSSMISSNGDMTEYLVLPLESDSKVKVALSIATTRAGGFPAEFLASLDTFVPLFSLSVAYKVEQSNFMRYSLPTSEKSSQLVFNGQIHPGDTISIESALGFVDLRGFTEASEKLPIQLFGVGEYFLQACLPSCLQCRWRDSKLWEMLFSLSFQLESHRKKPVTERLGRSYP